ncbi:hypothetical protein Tco_0351905 [Tanacetum coccineum]
MNTSVHGELTQESETLMNIKVDGLKLSDIFVVRDFIDVFLEDLSMTTMTTRAYHILKKDISDQVGLLSYSYDGHSWPTSKKSKEEQAFHLKLSDKANEVRRTYSRKATCLESTELKEKETRAVDFKYYWIWVILVEVKWMRPQASRYLIHSGADQTYYNLGDSIEATWKKDIATQYIQDVKLARINIDGIIARNGIRDDHLRLRGIIYLVVLADLQRGSEDAIGFKSKDREDTSFCKGTCKTIRDFNQVMVTLKWLRAHFVCATVVDFLWEFPDLDDSKILYATMKKEETTRT